MTGLNRVIFTGMQILIEREWKNDQAVIVEGGIIKAIIPANMTKHHLPAHQYEFPVDYYLVPGFIDTHVHGADGKDVMDANQASLQVISHALAGEGVTGFLATTMTADNDLIENALGVIAATQSMSEGATILGVHLEGPFIAKAKMGAQDASGIQPANIDLMQRWQEIAKGAIKLVTLAPEIPNALSLIKYLQEIKVIASVGHTNATYDETCAAIAAGCTRATHLFNAMSGIHQRAPGAVSALLLADDVDVELIVDGFHLAPAITELALRIKGKNKLMLVTDAMRAKCLGDGVYELGGQHVNVKAGKATLNDGTLAGSTLHMPQAIKNMVEFSGCTLADAIYMASYNPAQSLGLINDKGDITVGKHADLVVLDKQFNVILTMCQGREIYSR